MRLIQKACDHANDVNFNKANINEVECTCPKAFTKKILVINIRAGWGRLKSELKNEGK